MTAIGGRHVIYVDEALGEVAVGECPLCRMGLATDASAGQVQYLRYGPWVHDYCAEGAGVLKESLKLEVQ